MLLTDIHDNITDSYDLATIFFVVNPLFLMLVCRTTTDNSADEHWKRRTHSVTTTNNKLSHPVTATEQKSCSSTPAVALFATMCLSLLLPTDNASLLECIMQSSIGTHPPHPRPQIHYKCSRFSGRFEMTASTSIHASPEQTALSRTTLFVPSNPCRFPNRIKHPPNHTQPWLPD